MSCAQGYIAYDIDMIIMGFTSKCPAQPRRHTRRRLLINVKINLVENFKLYTFSLDEGFE